MSISTKKQQAEQAAAKYGFTVEKRRELTELKAILWEMCYEKNGARVLWLEREEENQTFAAAFKTIPCDDTGVFHILEHSVLCGSEKYPVSKPFVELIKSSLQTFINAFTFPDKTVYPVSSRNRQDFLNLMDVYLDAVLHPLCVSKEEIFRQEGWHYELTEGAEELTLNGVVYNEMKGVYASPDTLIDSELNKRLFPDNCYRFQSGGAPEAIPQLSYEQYTAAHRKFYHPSNAWFILDGDVDIEAVLEKIGGAVSGYDRQETDAGIPMQSPVSPGIQRITYEIGEGEDGVSRMLLAKGWVYGAGLPRAWTDALLFKRRTIKKSSVGEWVGRRRGIFRERKHPSALCIFGCQEHHTGKRERGMGYCAADAGGAGRRWFGA